MLLRLRGHISKPSYSWLSSAAKFILLCCSYFPWLVSLPGVGTLQEVQVRIIRQMSCQKMYQVLAFASDQVDILPDMICAGFPEGGRDSCQVQLTPLLLYARLSAHLLLIPMTLTLRQPCLVSPPLPRVIQGGPSCVPW